MKNKKLLKFLIIIIIAIFLFFISIFLIKLLKISSNTFNQNYGTMNIVIKNINILAEIADTDLKKTQGLSNKNSLDNDMGMIFIYNQEGYYPIWMKDMNFPIDIIWINKDLKIIDISKNITPQTYPENFKPQKPVQYILEVNANYADKNNININDQVILNR